MTILFSSSFTDNQDIAVGAWLGVFSINEDETPICYGASQWTGDQFSIAAWGDDATTTELDGFLTGDTLYIGYQLADGVIMGFHSEQELLYTTDAIEVVSEGHFNEVCNENGIFGCMDPMALNFNPSATMDDDNCEYNAPEGDCPLPEFYTGNTGVNMTVMLLPNFINSLVTDAEGAYVVALTETGLLVGSASVYDLIQNSFAIYPALCVV